MFINGCSKVQICATFIILCTWIVTIFLYINVSASKYDNVTEVKVGYSIHNRQKNVDHGGVTNDLGGSGKNESSLVKPVFLNTIDEYGVIRNLDDQFVRDLGYKQHAFNTLVSNNIGLYRSIPDTRHKLCSQQLHKNLLPASIVMCFFNEHLMTLLRSINTIFRRTPSNFLNEIILVDDSSDYDDLGEKLVLEITKIDPEKKVKIIRNNRREGLIRARVIGSRAATGDVLVFLDSHIEVNDHWIEPLLAVVAKEKSTLAVPVIDIINADTFSYTSSPLVRGGFNWGLHFKWEGLPEGTLVNESSFTGPFISPTMAGGLFAVDREYFRHIGEYDMGMDIWGGENLEISFRVWQCGGAIKILPCSRVGHVFRKRRPYSAPDGSNTMLRNSLRLAYVWMDEYKDYFLKSQNINKDFDFGNIDDRVSLRKLLHCKPFSWYIETVYPELDIPGKSSPKSAQQAFQPWYSRKRTYTGSFLLRLSNSTLCLSVDGGKINGLWKRGSTLSLRSCLRSKNQIWYETDKAELILDKLYCLEASHSSGIARPIMGKCHEMQGDQEWRHIQSVKSPLYNTATGSCLRATRAAIGAEVILDLCSKTDFSAWDIVS